MRKSKKCSAAERWIREVYTPWYNAQPQPLSGNNGPPPPPPGDGG